MKSSVKARFVQSKKKISEDIKGTHDEIKQRLESFQQKRHWLISHDHSTPSNFAHIFF